MKPDYELHKRPRYRWVILLTSLLAFIAYAFTFQVAPPLIQAVKSEFEIISDTEVALVMSIVLVPGILFSLPAGIVIRRYGVFKVGILSLLCVVVGSLVSAVASSFSILLVGRLVLGVGGTFILPTTPALISQWYTRDELGKAMGVFGVNMPLATVIAFPAASLLLNACGWRFPFVVGLVIAIAAVALFGLLAREGPLLPKERLSNARQAVGNFEIWRLGIVWLSFSAAALSFTTWAPTLFERFQSIPRVQASVYASLLSWAAIFCVPFFGYMSDRSGKRKGFAAIGLLSMTIVFVALAFSVGLVLISLVIALGVVAAMVPPIASSLPPEIVGQGYASVGFGITAMCSNIGAALSQPWIGSILDSTQAYAPCLFGMVGVAATGALVACTMKTR